MLKTAADRITAARFLLSLALFAVFAWIEASAVAATAAAAWTAFALFVVAALTDTVDGIVARRYGASDFGRVADPFVDKVLVVGALVFLSAMHQTRATVPAWTVVVILAREFLVTGLRGFVESKGRAFPADAWGKLKMVLQCLTIGGGILCMVPRDGGVAGAFPRFFSLVPTLTAICLTAALLVTVGSGLFYLVRAWRYLSPQPTPRP